MLVGLEIHPSGVLVTLVEDVEIYAKNGSNETMDGLIHASLALRPADILTAASHPTPSWSLSMVGICAPHAVDAGLEQHNISRYETFSHEFTAQRIRYEPATINRYGRRQLDTTRMIT